MIGDGANNASLCALWFIQPFLGLDFQGKVEHNRRSDKCHKDAATLNRRY